MMGREQLLIEQTLRANLAEADRYIILDVYLEEIVSQSFNLPFFFY